MPLAAVPRPDYQGDSGVHQLRQLQRELIKALREGDWLRVRELDRACAGLVDRVVAANHEDGTTLVSALIELKGVYSNLIDSCHSEVLKMAL